ncbi:MAG: outer membrane protein assembly factor BamE [Gammaproteobacteria bacterium]|nr:outer membrane protein assembly factor BamE [Gammaproteobacteria bacterium]
MRKNLIFIAILSSVNLASCTSILPEPHKIDIQQGNRVKQEDFEKLKLGMNRKQVIFILGTPLLQDGFHQNRWDYLFYLIPGNAEPRQSRLSLFFENDILVRIDDSQYTPEVQEIEPAK